MQQEAVSRVHEFQQRAQTYYDTPVIGEPAVQPVIEAESRVIDPPVSAGQLPAPSDDAASKEAVPSQQQQHQQHPQHPTDPIQGLMEKFNLDSETLLILGLMFLLYNEKADNFLLMALAYLLL